MGIRPPLYGHSYHLGWATEVELKPLVVVIIACAPGLGVMQSRAPSIEAWPRRGGSNLSILQAATLKA